MIQVTVLGCGPAGLMAVHGAVVASDVAQIPIDIKVVSHKQKSPLYGCQYLHQPIPGVPPVASAQVAYRLRGSADGYREKVYGKGFTGTVSPEDLVGEHKAWDIRATYDWLWKRYSNLIIDGDITPRSIWSLDGLIISSIPRPSICHQGHQFGSTEITAAGDAPDLGIYVSNQFQCDEDSVVCNGEESPSWYRMSRVFGHTTVEWPQTTIVIPVSTASRVTKPTETDCNCHPNITHVGRYGTWRKGVLSHTAYWRGFLETSRALRSDDGTAA
jgi:hypothetical protein